MSIDYDIEIIKNQEDMFPVSPEDAPYVLVCNKHGETALAMSMADAQEMYEDSSVWCEDCLHAEILAGGM